MKSFAHVQVSCFILESIRQPYQKENSSYYIDIDDPYIYIDDYNETIFKTKKEYIELLDKVNNKINNIIYVNKIIIKIKDELNDKIQSIYEIIFKLSNDSRLRRDELNKIDAIIDDMLNFVCNKICRENITSSENINRNKYKDID